MVPLTHRTDLLHCRELVLPDPIPATGAVDGEGDAADAIEEGSGVNGLFVNVACSDCGRLEHKSVGAWQERDHRVLINLAASTFVSHKLTLACALDRCHAFLQVLPDPVLRKM